MFDLKTIRTQNDESPKDYHLTDPGLKKAIDMAIWLQKPLLVTGAPGTGKTKLAWKLAYELSTLGSEQLKDQLDNPCAPFIETPFVFNTKTVSNASDLFYHYDAIGHFRERPVDNEEEEIIQEADKTRVILKAKADSERVPAYKYIELNALGRAIVQTWGKRKILATKQLQQLRHLHKFSELQEQPMSSVVLVDEIDKAPRDFPNDLLNEMENLEFNIRELNQAVTRNPDSPSRIVVLMTSNFEKNLPDAFLRRCLFYHIQPPQEKDLLKIVCSRMRSYLEQFGLTHGTPSADRQSLEERYRPLIAIFQEISKSATDKSPTTSELLEWIKVLELEGFFSQGNADLSVISADQLTILHYSLPILLKSKEDMDRLLIKYPPPKQ
jgi:MoxR-like ATPase